MKLVLTHEHHTLSEMKMEDFVKDISKNIELMNKLKVMQNHLLYLLA